jgi:hypothetical protein
LKVNLNEIIKNFLIPTGLAVLFLGPALQPGSIFNLDLILIPNPALLDGFWGIGPELGRVSPWAALLTLISNFIPATISFKVFFILIFQLSWLGMSRLAREIGIRLPFLASVLYTTSPFLLTRISVGHLGISLMFALLPWTISTLLRPTQNLQKLFLYSTAMAFAGYASGSITLLIVVVGCIFTRATFVRRICAVTVVALAQSVWLIPGIIVSLSSTRQLPPANVFATNFGTGILQIFSLSAGGGFWNPNFQLGPSRGVLELIGFLLLLIAIRGQHRIPNWLRNRLLAVGAIGWILAAQSKLPGINESLSWLTNTSIGQIARESQRYTALHLIWVVPAFCLGVDYYYEKFDARPKLRYLVGGIAALPLAMASILATPAIWGLEGSLEAVQIPECWNTAKARISENPGTILSLPWFQYFDQKIGSEVVRRTLDPMPYFLKGDVIHSSNNELGENVSENGDPRELYLGNLIQKFLNEGTPPSNALRSLGVRWVVVQQSVIIDDFSRFETDQGMTRVIKCSDLDLYLVKMSQADASTASRQNMPVNQLFPGLIRIGEANESPVIVNQPWSRFWFMGFDSLDKSEDGRLLIPRGNTYIWNLGMVLVITCYALQSFIVIWLIRLRWRRRLSPKPRI